MFESVVLIIMPFFDFIAAHASFGIIGSAALIFTNWCIFHYHEVKTSEYEYFMENIHFTLYFSAPTYHLYRTIAMGFPPAGFFVLVYSVCTLFRTEMFMNTFSIKGKFNMFKLIKQRSTRFPQLKQATKTRKR